VTLGLSNQDSRTIKMRKSLLALSLAAALASSVAFADQKTLDAMVAAGVELTPEQAELVLNADEESIADVVAALVAAAGDNESLVSAIVSAAISANPEASSQIFSAAVATAPNMVASIAEGVATGEAAAAGPGPGTGPGAGALPGQASPIAAATLGQLAAGNIPSAGGGGGGGTPSSPN